MVDHTQYEILNTRAMLLQNICISAGVLAVVKALDAGPESNSTVALRFYILPFFSKTWSLFKCFFENYSNFHLNDIKCL